MKTLLLVLLSLTLVSKVYALEQVEFSIGDWSPYTSQSDQNGKLAESIIIEAFELEGVKVKLIYNKWSDSYDEALNGVTDGTFPWSIKENSLIDFYISQTLIAQKQVFFSLESTGFDWLSFDDLSQYKIAATKAYAHIQDLEKNNINYILSNTDLDSFNKVLSGEADAYPSSEVVGKQLINSTYSKVDAAKFVTHPIPMTIDNMYLLVSKKKDNGEEIIQTFNKGLIKLQLSGRYNTILNSLRVN